MAGEPSGIFTGREALAAVAQERGAWDWVFVGPDPEELPLAGGGSGSVEAMRCCLAEHGATVLFGLLRVVFGTGRMRRTKWLCIVASTIDEAVEGGATGSVARAMGKRPAMLKALAGFVHYVAVIEATSMDDLTVEEVVERVRKVCVVDSDDISAASFRAALEELRQAEASPAAAPGVADPTCEVPAEDAVTTELGAAGTDSAAVAARASVAPPAIPPLGSSVEVWSASEARWLMDGVVDEMLTCEAVREGTRLPPGSIKVLYKGGSRGKWLAPEQCATYLRPFKLSPPPKLAGLLLKETHNFITEWHMRYFELSGGTLSWWASAADAAKGVKPQRTLELFGLRLHRHSLSSTKFRLTTESSQGVVYNFDSSVGQGSLSIEDWLESLREHAVFCSHGRGQ